MWNNEILLDVSKIICESTGGDSKFEIETHVITKSKSDSARGHMSAGESL